jgi:hypothetical protein
VTLSPRPARRACLDCAGHVASARCPDVRTSRESPLWTHERPWTLHLCSSRAPRLAGRTHRRQSHVLARACVRAHAAASWPHLVVEHLKPFPVVCFIEVVAQESSRACSFISVCPSSVIRRPPTWFEGACLVACPARVLPVWRPSVLLLNPAVSPPIRQDAQSPAPGEAAPGLIFGKNRSRVSSLTFLDPRPAKSSAHRPGIPPPVRSSPPKDYIAAISFFQGLFP